MQSLKFGSYLIRGIRAGLPCSALHLNRMHSCFSPEMICSINISIPPIGACTPLTQWTIATNRAEAVKAYSCLPSTPDHYHIYCDGSKRPEGAGAAAIEPCRNKHFKQYLKPETSILIAELMGILFGIQLAKNLPKTALHCTIHVDSHPAIFALTVRSQSKRATKVTTRIRIALDELSSQRPDLMVDFFWVPSHEGIAGNSAAHALAGEATRLSVLNKVQKPTSAAETSTAVNPKSPSTRKPAVKLRVKKVATHTVKE